MELKDDMKLAANVFIDVHDAAGTVIEHREVHNLTVSNARGLVRDALSGVTSLTHIAIGTGNVAPAVGNTALGTERYRDVITLYDRTNADKLVLKFYVPTGSANGYTYTEAGIFNASSSGTMYARATFAGISKTAAVAMTITWELTFTTA